MPSENNEIVAEFITESREHLADIENQLLTIESQGTALDIELVNTVFRSVHSIKGAAGFLGFQTIGTLAHSLENVLNLMRNRELSPNAENVDVLLRAADALRGLINDIDHSNEVDVSTHVSALKRVIEGQASPAAQSNMSQTMTLAGPEGHGLHLTRQMLDTQNNRGQRLYVVDFDLIRDVQEKSKTPLALLKDLLTYGELLDSSMDHANWGSLEKGLPSQMRFVVLFGTMLEEAELVATAFEIPVERVRRVEPAEIETVTTPPAAQPKQSAASTAAPAATPAAAHDNQAPATAQDSAPAKAAAPGTPAETSIRVSISLLDHLMNLAGELVLGRNQLLQMIATKDSSRLEAVAAKLNQVTSELQETIMQTRMQPIGSVFNKFPRVVRDLSGKLGKQCDLVIEGKDVELDKSIIETIGDPLTHLVRNSVDHGIELPSVRTSRGKRPTGTITLKAYHQAGKVNIRISDDGAGIDAEKLKQKAVEKGLITAAQAREMSQRDAIRLIFHPGFSTAEKVTDVSGRGVGMDVVRTNIQKAGGVVEVETEVGAGTNINIKLPLTLAIIPSLIVRCGHERFAIPQVSISELVRIKASEISRKIERVSGAEVLRLRGNLLPLLRLSKALDIHSKYLDPATRTLKDNARQTITDRRVEPATDGDSPPSDRKERRGDTDAGALNIIVVETGHLRYGLIVDGLHDSEEIVVKPLGSHLKGTPCLAGATILGDGKVALILDIPGIATHCQLTMPAEDGKRQVEARTSQDRLDTQTLLLFTNDPSEQFGTPMSLISRIERIRADQIDSVGGQEVLQYRGASLPLLSLEHYTKSKPRAQQKTLYVIAFRVARQEVGLIAPTLVDIRNVSGQIDTVTFREPGINGSMVIDDKTTRLIDLMELARGGHPEWFNKTPTQEQAAAPQSAGGMPHILLAEDSAFFRSQVQGFLTGEGYSVLAAEDGSQAWDLLQHTDQPVTLVVTDIEMPRMDGYGLTRKIKSDSRFAHLPVIALTSLAGEEDVKRGTEAGVDCYQVKLDRDQLLEMVARYMKAAGRPAGSDTGRSSARTQES